VDAGEFLEHDVAVAVALGDTCPAEPLGRRQPDHTVLARGQPHLAADETVRGSLPR
jgi:hypothetical protein